MIVQEYIQLQAQIDRQTPEQQAYYDAADAATAQANAIQPDIDAAKVALADAQAALEAAITAGEDPAPYQAAVNAAQSELDTLTTEQNSYWSQVATATQAGDGIGMMIAECQALIDADPTPPTPGQQAAAQAEWLAYLLLLRREAAAKAIQQNPVLVAELPIALGQAGLRAFVLDATKDKFGDNVLGGGANKVPVYSDGLIWRIG